MYFCNRQKNQHMQSDKNISEEELIFETKRDKAIQYFSALSESEEELNDFIIDALIDYEIKKMPAQSVLARIIASPYVFINLLIVLIRQLFTMTRDFLLYGGEMVTYKEHRSLKTVNHFYRQMLRNAKKT